VWTFPFSIQLSALPDAETMLLIYDDKSQVSKNQILLYQGMCADYWIAAPGGDALQ